jgi:hypothetical protein
LEKTNYKEMIPFELQSGLDEPQIEGMDVSTFMLSLLQIRDQAHILHWQTTNEAQHNAFGAFYDDFLGLVDEIAEQVIGKYGRFKVGGSAILVMDYESAMPIFIQNIEKVFCQDFCEIFEQESNTELYNLRDEFLSLKNKLAYRLTLD